MLRSLQDAIYNWLSIKVVCEARPDDTAAKETEQDFSRLLQEEYAVSHIQVEKEEELYFVSCHSKGEEHTYRFPKELIDCMLDSIKENPDRYRNYE
ncbi:hypothetical protein IEO70_00560 [Bacillus sp. AGMB 02131]|uniref:Uncharacterized protein n=1 Tax=Peribacillus faecalis TaxID=2772559 RepID=A0A927HAZ2_9BACI|nr:hypothetical protein [Peribacillus faecalis]MBD3106868.1 hypothetical protein [Peribacillus faecalis]